MPEIKNDSFEFVYELLTDYALRNVDILTGFEQKWLTSIREQFKYLHDHILER